MEDRESISDKTLISQQNGDIASVGPDMPTDAVPGIYSTEKDENFLSDDVQEESPRVSPLTDNAESLNSLDCTGSKDDSVNQYTEVINSEIRVFGVSLIGRSHIATNDKCQDYHRYSDLGYGWHIFLLSDGAGSAKESHRGSKIVCEAGLKLIERTLSKLEWQETNYVPSETEWNIEFTAICRKLKQYMEEQIDMLDEDVKTKDFNATLEVLIVTPHSMLSGHIGDGRMGYQSVDNSWHSIMTPHKGEEKNQTLFVLNPWDKNRVPAYKIKGIYVPETRVINEHPKAIMLLSDGCENFSWNCTQYSEYGETLDINTPYVEFWNDLRSELSIDSNLKDSFVKFVETYNEGCLKETDDRTMIFAEFIEPKLTDENL